MAGSESDTQEQEDVSMDEIQKQEAADELKHEWSELNRKSWTDKFHRFAAGLLAGALALFVGIIFMLIGNLGIWDTGGGAFAIIFAVIYAYGLMIGGSIAVGYYSFWYLYGNFSSTPKSE